MTAALQDFATACYRRSGVAACCLRLQDMLGADVNMLLTAAWLAEQGRRWQSDQVRELIASCTSWREHCVLPLRAVRRYLTDASMLYSQAKALELNAEMYQLRVLETALAPMSLQTQTTPTADALTVNLRTYFDCIASARRASIDADIRALIEALQH